MERYRYIAKRLLTAIPTFLGITILVYVVASLAPSSPLEILFNDPYATAEEMARKSKELGLDQPVIIQYIRWLVQLVQGNMGMSIRTNGQVLDMILERIGPTLILTGSAMALTIIIALPLGIMSAYKPYSGWDYISSGLSFIGSAMPNFFAGLVLIYFFCIKVKLFPTSGMYDSSGVRTWPMFFHHLVLPAVVLAIQQIGSLIRQCRGSMLEVLQDDYVRTARAKGLHEPSVLVRHALRNAWIPLVSWFGMQIPLPDRRGGCDGADIWMARAGKSDGTVHQCQGLSCYHGHHGGDCHCGVIGQPAGRPGVRTVGSKDTL